VEASALSRWSGPRSASRWTTGIAIKGEGFELSHVGVKKVIEAAEGRRKQQAA
jgi:hypothetical protein